MFCGSSNFETFTSFGYLGGNFMAFTNLAAVGTNFHTVRMDFQGSQISVYFDGIQRISMTDAEGTFYTNGGVSLDLWTDSSGYLDERGRRRRQWLAIDCQ